MTEKPTREERTQERRKRLDKLADDRRKRLLEAEEKKKMTVILKENADKNRKIEELEERVAALERGMNQLRLDFARYRARNK